MKSPTIPRRFLERIPKTDLHLHLDGSLRIPTLIELARAAGVALPSETTEGLLETVFKARYSDLPDYLQGFAYTTAVLQTPEALERVAQELGEDNIAEGVRYIEVRYAPQLHLNQGMEIRDVIGAVHRGLERAQRAFNNRPEVQSGAELPFHYGIIVCAMRAFHPELGSYYRKLLDVMPHAPRHEIGSAASLEMARAAVQIRDETGWPIVGFDIAGEEAGYPAGEHADAFHYAHKNFLKKTIHAGEAFGPESIFQAITEGHANRIGHGTFLFAADRVTDPTIADPQRYVELLAEYIASQRITIEVCLTSNIQTTPEIQDVRRHPVANMLDHELSVSICTDNRLVSRTSVSDELERLVNDVPCDPHRLRNVVVAGFKGSFFPGSYRNKRAFVRQVIRRYDELAAEYGLASPRGGGAAG
ncbi:MAG: adenosine deaminase family protein [Kiritimatiellae bacterium]|nr:adenosine deaminase family protein [Kiritimatiellia bacterium]